MNRSRVAGRRCLLPVLLTVFMAGCAPIQLGPTVMSSMGPGKTFDMYQADLTSCKGFASDQVKGSTSVMNQRVIDAILSGQDVDHSNDANDHAYIQQQVRFRVFAVHGFQRRRLFRACRRLLPWRRLLLSPRLLIRWSERRRSS